jgi:hypothetical protein
MYPILYIHFLLNDPYKNKENRYSLL